MANDTQNVAMVAGKRYLPKVSNAYFYIKGMLAFEATANTDSSVNIQTTQDQIRGGQNNTVIGTITSEKTVDASFSTPEWKIEFLAANIGETIQIGKFGFTVSDKPYTLKEGKITLTERPLGNEIFIESNDGYVKVTVPDNSLDVDLSNYNLTDECVVVIGVFDKNGKRVNISADTDPCVGKLVLSTPIFEGTKGKVGTSEYVFPAFALSGNFEHTSGADSARQISGTAVATKSAVCGEGQSYGYYQETIDDEDINSFSMIVAAPSAVELAVDETEKLTVYGTKGALYAKTEITGATFATSEADKFTVDANTGVITAVAVGTGTVTVTYNGMTTTVDVEVVAKA